MAAENNRRFYLSKRFRWTALVTASITGLVVISAYLISAFQPIARVPSLPTAPLHDSTFAFISDTQSPLWLETLVLQTHRNEEMRLAVLQQILKSYPAALFHCGDLVALGFDQNDWRTVDEFTELLAKERIPFFPVLGNHEYMLFPGRGEENFVSRYPHASPTGYTVRIGGVAFILLNSNFGRLGSELAEKQDRWYRDAIEKADADSSVRGTIVACHHPPFTNSTIVQASEEVRARFVPAFVKSAKGKLFVSGHCHSFEHFVQEDKNFLVIGGGGGLLQPILPDSLRQWIDKISIPSAERMFHYLSGNLTPDGIRLSVWMVKPDDMTFTKIYNFQVPW